MTDRQRPAPIPMGRPTIPVPASRPPMLPAQIRAPGGLKGRIMASAARPNAIAVLSSRANVAAFTKPDTLDKWNAGLRAAAGDDAPETITIYDVIGYDWWTDGGVTVNRIDAALRQIGADTDVEVHINSPGGDMFEGIAIFNRLLEHKGKVTVKVMGLAASAASIIAMAGETIEMGPGSFFMIHNCWVSAAGNRHDFAEVAAFLTPFDDAMAGVYAQRTGMKKAEVAKLMDAESWLSADQSVEKGFADKLLRTEDITENAQAKARAEAVNADRQAEWGLCRSMSRDEARGLIAKLKGAPGAHQTTPAPGAADDWAGVDFAAALNALRS